jgi:hypothetical protein
MKFKALLLSTVLSLATLQQVSAFGIQVGPFSLQLGGVRINRALLKEEPVCYAIEKQKQLELLIKSVETSKLERKISIQRVVIEPYLFGLKEGQPIIQGNIISQKMVKEITVKYGEDESDFDDDDEEERDYYINKYKKSGIFGKLSFFKDRNEVKTFDIQDVLDLYVLEDSHFDVPKSLENLKTENVEVICRINSSK